MVQFPGKVQVSTCSFGIITKNLLLSLSKCSFEIINYMVSPCPNLASFPKQVFVFVIISQISGLQFLKSLDEIAFKMLFILIFYASIKNRRRKNRVWEIMKCTYFELKSIAYFWRACLPPRLVQLPSSYLTVFVSDDWKDCPV